MKLLAYLGERIGDELDAVVTGVEEYGLFAQGIELPAEGLIHVSSLADDYYSFDRRTHSLSGRRSGNSFRLGDVIRVAVARVDVDRRELDLRIVTGAALAARLSNALSATCPPARPLNQSRRHIARRIACHGTRRQKDQPRRTEEGYEARGKKREMRPSSDRHRGH